MQNIKDAIGVDPKKSTKMAAVVNRLADKGEFLTASLELMGVTHYLSRDISPR